MTKVKLLNAAALSASVLVFATSAAMAQQVPCGANQGYGLRQDADCCWQQGMGSGQGMGLGNAPSMGQQGTGPRYMMRFAAIDRDQDGVVSAEEAADNVETVFYEIDANEDEAVSLEELMAVHKGPGAAYNPARQQARQARKAARFVDMDVDSDGFVNKSEFMGAGEKRFAASDTDQDGKVTPWEFRSSRRRF